MFIRLKSAEKSNWFLPPNSLCRNMHVIGTIIMLGAILHPCSGLSPPSYRPCWAHKNRPRPFGRLRNRFLLRLTLYDGFCFYNRIFYQLRRSCMILIHNGLYSGCDLFLYQFVNKFRRGFMGGFGFYSQVCGGSVAHNDTSGGFLV